MFTRMKFKRHFKNDWLLKAAKHKFVDYPWIEEQIKTLASCNVRDKDATFLLILGRRTKGQRDVALPSIIYTYGAGQARHSWSRATEADTFLGHCDSDRSPCGHYETDDEVENLRLLIKQKRVELIYSG